MSGSTTIGARGRNLVADTIIGLHYKYIKIRLIQEHNSPPIKSRIVAECQAPRDNSLLRHSRLQLRKFCFDGPLTHRYRLCLADLLVF